MKWFIRGITFICIILLASSACGNLQNDHTGPVISEISTSGKVVVISDCLATSVTITAKVTDASNVKNVVVWYRVGSGQSFASSNMNLQNGIYTVSVKGSDLQGHGYGAMEFYITAQDGQGHASQSPIDNSIQFLPCVSN